MPLDDFFTTSELKDGFTNTSRAEKLVSFIQSNTFSAGDDVFRQWTTIARTIGATKNKECLNGFVNSGGIRYLNLWLIDAHKFNDGKTDKSTEELIIALLKALANLCVENVNLSTYPCSTLKKLAKHSSFEIRGQAKNLLKVLEASKEKSNKEKYRLLEDKDQDKGFELRNKKSLDSNVSDTKCESNEVNSEEPIQSSSEKLSNESGQSRDDGLHRSKGVSVGEKRSFDDDVKDEKKKKPENEMMKNDDIEESAKSEVCREKIPFDFDLNQDLCPDETDVVTTNTGSSSPLKSVSDTVKSSSNAPLGVEISKENKMGSSVTSSGGRGRKRKVDSEDITTHADNEGEKDDKSQSDKKRRTNSVTISENFGEIDKTSADIELGTSDALEVGTKAAKEADSKELSQSSSEKLYDESGQPRDDNLHTSSPSKRLSVGENQSFEDSKPENEMINNDDVEKSRIFRDFDLNVAKGNDQVEEQLHFYSSNPRGGVSSYEANIHGSNEDEDIPAPQSSSSISSSQITQQLGKEVNFELNEKPKSPEEQSIVLFGTKMAVGKIYSKSEMDKPLDLVSNMRETENSAPISQKLGQKVKFDLNEKPKSPQEEEEAVYLFGKKIAVGNKLLALGDNEVTDSLNMADTESTPMTTGWISNQQSSLSQEQRSGENVKLSSKRKERETPLEIPQRKRR